MLDQNTDRMWFVIGAVIVGAAIIFIANGTLPDLFASVSENFEKSSSEGTSVVSDIAPMLPTDGVNLLKYGHLEVHGSQGVGSSGVVGTGWRPEFMRLEDLAPIIERFDMEDTYTLSFEAKSKDVSNRNRMSVYMQSGSGSKYGLISTQFTVTEEYQTYSFNGLKPFVYTSSYRYADKVNKVPYETAHLAFYGGYGTGNVPVVRNVRLERELR